MKDNYKIYYAFLKEQLDLLFFSLENERFLGAESIDLDFVSCLYKVKTRKEKGLLISLFRIVLGLCLLKLVLIFLWALVWRHLDLMHFAQLVLIVSYALYYISVFYGLSHFLKLKESLQIGYQLEMEDGLTKRGSLKGIQPKSNLTTQRSRSLSNCKYDSLIPNRRISERKVSFYFDFFPFTRRIRLPSAKNQLKLIAQVNYCWITYILLSGQETSMTKLACEILCLNLVLLSTHFKAIFTISGEFYIKPVMFLLMPFIFTTIGESNTYFVLVSIYIFMNHLNHIEYESLKLVYEANKKKSCSCGSFPGYNTREDSYSVQDSKETKTLHKSASESKFDKDNTSFLKLLSNRKEENRFSSFASSAKMPHKRESLPPLAKIESNMRKTSSAKTQLRISQILPFTISHDVRHTVTETLEKVNRLPAGLTKLSIDRHKFNGFIANVLENCRTCIFYYNCNKELEYKNQNFLNLMYSLKMDEDHKSQCRKAIQKSNTLKKINSSWSFKSNSNFLWAGQFTLSKKHSKFPLNRDKRLMNIYSKCLNYDDLEGMPYYFRSDKPFTLEEVIIREEISYSNKRLIDLGVYTKGGNCSKLFRVYKTPYRNRNNKNFAHYLRASSSSNLIHAMSEFSLKDNSRKSPCEELNLRRSFSNFTPEFKEKPDPRVMRMNSDLSNKEESAGSGLRRNKTICFDLHKAKEKKQKVVINAPKSRARSPNKTRPNQLHRNSTWDNFIIKEEDADQTSSSKYPSSKKTNELSRHRDSRSNKSLSDNRIASIEEDSMEHIDSIKDTPTHNDPKKEDPQPSKLRQSAHYLGKMSSEFIPNAYFNIETKDLLSEEIKGRNSSSEDESLTEKIPSQMVSNVTSNRREISFDDRASFNSAENDMEIVTGAQSKIDVSGDDTDISKYQVFQEFVNEAECIFFVEEVTSLVEHTTQVNEAKYINIINGKLAHEIKTPCIAINSHLNDIDHSLRKNFRSCEKNINSLASSDYYCDPAEQAAKQDKIVSSLAFTSKHITEKVVKIKCLTDQFINIVTQIGDFARGINPSENRHEEIEMEEIVQWGYWYTKSLLSEEKRKKVRILLVNEIKKPKGFVRSDTSKSKEGIKDKDNTSHEKDVNCLKPLEHLKIESDLTKVKIIISEVLKNSIQYVSQGEITIGTKEVDGSSVEYFVKDTGAGISRALLEKILRNFKYLENQFAQYSNSPMPRQLVLKPHDENTERDASSSSPSYFKSNSRMLHPKQILSEMMETFLKKGSLNIGLQFVKLYCLCLGVTMKLESNEGSGTCVSFTFKLSSRDFDLEGQNIRDSLNESEVDKCKDHPRLDANTPIISKEKCLDPQYFSTMNLDFASDFRRSNSFNAQPNTLKSAQKLMTANLNTQKGGIATSGTITDYFTSSKPCRKSGAFKYICRSPRLGRRPDFKKSSTLVVNLIEPSTSLLLRNKTINKVQNCASDFDSDNVNDSPKNSDYEGCELPTEREYSIGESPGEYMSKIMHDYVMVESSKEFAKPAHKSHSFCANKNAGMFINSLAENKVKKVKFSTNSQLKRDSVGKLQSGYLPKMERTNSTDSLLSSVNYQNFKIEISGISKNSILELDPADQPKSNSKRVKMSEMYDFYGNSQVKGNHLDCELSPDKLSSRRLHLNPPAKENPFRRVATELLQDYQESQDKQFQILIVDDDYHCRKNASNVLMKIFAKHPDLKSQYSILKLQDGLDTLNLVINDSETRKIRLVISDENMKFINGSDSFSLLTRLFGLGKLSKIPLVILTALEDHSHVKKVSQADEVLKKPANKNIIEEVILKYLK